MSNLVSIALCTFNGEKHLREQLDSLFSQTYSNIEIVAVDDNSTDSSFDILQSYCLKHDNLTVYRNAVNLGLVSNFEKALSLCKGEFIALSDQDDIWCTKKVEILINKIEGNTLIFHDSELFGTNDIGDNKLASSKFGIYEGNGNLNFVRSNCISGHAMMFKKDLLKYILPFPNQLSFHDWWIAFQAASHGKIIYINDVLVSYRQHGGMFTKKLPTDNPNLIASIDLEWLELISRQHNIPNERKIKEIEKFFRRASKGFRGLSFFIFLIRNSSIVLSWQERHKSQLSRLNRIRKIYFEVGKGNTK